MNLTQLKQYILDQLAAPVNVVQKIINVFNAVVDYFVGNQVTSIIPDWASGLTFQLDGTDAGKFCLYPDANGKKRIFETKVSNNTNNVPPSDPNLSENTYWIEVSQAGSSAIVEWEPKLYGSGLVIVFHDHSTDGPGFYQLLEPTRPFSSSNIETELTDTPAKWRRIGGVNSGGGGGPAIADNYANIAAMIAAQVDQEENALYYVSDASTDPTVDSGWAVYRYLGTTDGDLDDYQKLSEEESLDVVFNVLGAALTGYSPAAGTISATDTILQAFNKIGNFISSIATTIRGTVLTGYTVGSNAAIAAGDTILQAFGKIQAQLNAKMDIADIDATAVSLSSGTLTLNANSKRQRKFHVSSPISSNFTLTITNKTNLQYLHLTVFITGTVVVTLDSDVVAEVQDSRFNNTSKQLTIIGTTASPFELSFARHGSLFLLKRSTRYYAS